MPRTANTRERILTAAAKVLSVKGYSGTRLTDIADVAMLRAPAVYHYFASREELVAEVMAVGQQRLREYVTTVLDTLPPDTTPMDRICAAVEAHLLVTLGLSDFATAATRNSGQLPEELRSRQQVAGRQYLSIWQELLYQAHEAGEIRADLDLRAARMLVIGALNWTPEWWDSQRGSLDVVVRTAQGLVRNGLSPDGHHKA